METMETTLYKIKLCNIGPAFIQESDPQQKLTSFLKNTPPLILPDKLELLNDQQHNIIPVLSYKNQDDAELMIIILSKGQDHINMYQGYFIYVEEYQPPQEPIIQQINQQPKQMQMAASSSQKDDIVGNFDRPLLIPQGKNDTQTGIYEERYKVLSVAYADNIFIYFEAEDIKNQNKLVLIKTLVDEINLDSTRQGLKPDKQDTSQLKETKQKLYKRQLNEEGYVINQLEGSEKTLKLIQFYLDAKFLDQIGNIKGNSTALVMEHGQMRKVQILIKQIIQLYGQLDQFIVKQWFSQLVNEVACMHEKGYCHFDIRLENVIITSDLNLKLSNFSMALKTDGKPLNKKLNIQNKLTAPPETQAADTIYEGKPVDIYMLGYLFLMILSNQKAVGYQQHMKKEQIAQNTDPKVQAIVNQMMSVDPKDRPDIINLKGQFEKLVQDTKMVGLHETKMNYKKLLEDLPKGVKVELVVQVPTAPSVKQKQVITQVQENVTTITITFPGYIQDDLPSKHFMKIVKIALKEQNAGYIISEQINDGSFIIQKQKSDQSQNNYQVLIFTIKPEHNEETDSLNYKLEINQLSGHQMQFQQFIDSLRNTSIMQFELGLLKKDQQTRFLNFEKKKLRISSVPSAITKDYFIKVFLTKSYPQLLDKIASMDVSQQKESFSDSNIITLILKDSRFYNEVKDALRDNPIYVPKQAPSKFVDLMTLKETDLSKPQMRNLVSRFDLVLVELEKQTFKQQVIVQGVFRYEINFLNICYAKYLSNDKIQKGLAASTLIFNLKSSTTLQKDFISELLLQGLQVSSSERIQLTKIENRYYSNCFAEQSFFQKEIVTCEKERVHYYKQLIKQLDFQQLREKYTQKQVNPEPGTSQDLKMLKPITKIEHLELINTSISPTEQLPEFEISQLKLSYQDDLDLLSLSEPALHERLTTILSRFNPDYRDSMEFQHLQFVAIKGYLLKHQEYSQTIQAPAVGTKRLFNEDTYQKLLKQLIGEQDLQKRVKIISELESQTKVQIIEQNTEKIFFPVKREKQMRQITEELKNIKKIQHPKIETSEENKELDDHVQKSFANVAEAQEFLVQEFITSEFKRDELLAFHSILTRRYRRQVVSPLSVCLFINDLISLQPPDYLLSIHHEILHYCTLGNIKRAFMLIYLTLNYTHHTDYHKQINDSINQNLSTPYQKLLNKLEQQEKAKLLFRTYNTHLITMKEYLQLKQQVLQLQSIFNKDTNDKDAFKESRKKTPKISEENAKQISQTLRIVMKKACLSRESGTDVEVYKIYRNLAIMYPEIGNQINQHEAIMTLTPEIVFKVFDQTVQSMSSQQNQELIKKKQPIDDYKVDQIQPWVPLQQAQLQVYNQLPTMINQSFVPTEIKTSFLKQSILNCSTFQDTSTIGDTGKAKIQLNDNTAHPDDQNQQFLLQMMNSGALPHYQYHSVVDTKLLQSEQVESYQKFTKARPITIEELKMTSGEAIQEASMLDIPGDSKLGESLSKSGGDEEDDEEYDRPFREDITYSREASQFEIPKNLEQLEEYLKQNINVDKIINITINENDTIYLHSQVLRIAFHLDFKHPEYKQIYDKSIAQQFIEAVHQQSTQIHHKINKCDDLQDFHYYQLIDFFISGPLNNYQQIPKSDESLQKVNKMNPLAVYTKKSICTIVKNLIIKEPLIINTPKAKIKPDTEEQKLKKLLTVIYEQQVLQLLELLNPQRRSDQCLNSFKELIIITQDHQVVGYYGSRQKKNLLSNIKDPIKLERILFLTLEYMADLHQHKTMFHGDLNAENIFYEDEESTLILTDSDSLLLMDCQSQDKKVFKVSNICGAAGSVDFKNKIRRKENLSQNELLMEDKYQLWKTFIDHIKNKKIEEKQTQFTKELLQKLDHNNEEKKNTPLTTIFTELSTYPQFCLEYMETLRNTNCPNFSYYFWKCFIGSLSCKLIRAFWPHFILSITTEEEKERDELLQINSTFKRVNIMFMQDLWLSYVLSPPRSDKEIQQNLEDADIDISWLLVLERIHIKMLNLFSAPSQQMAENQINELIEYTMALTPENRLYCIEAMVYSYNLYLNFLSEQYQNQSHSIQAEFIYLQFIYKLLSYQPLKPTEKLKVQLTKVITYRSNKRLLLATPN